MPEWFESLDAEHLEHVTSKGWNKPLTPEIAAGMAQAHRNAERLIGHPADQVLKLPKDAADPSYPAIYDRVVGMSAPKTADEYKFDGIKHADGNDIDAAEVAFQREQAVKYKLTQAQVRGMAADRTARTDTVAAGQASVNEAARAANQVTLRAAWGSEYDIKVNAATQAGPALGFTPEVFANMTSQSPAAYVQNMNALVSLAAQMQEAKRIGGGGGGPTPLDVSAGLTPVQAHGTLQQKQMDPEWSKKALSGMEPAYTEWKNLTVAATRR